MGFVSLVVDPESLRAAAGTMALLPSDIDRAPHLGAGPEAAKLTGSAVGAALGLTDALSKQAKDVLKGRYDEIAGLLTLSANSYHGSDIDAAKRLADIGDLNSGDPHTKK